LNKKNIRRIVILLQLFLIAALFLPAGKIMGIDKSGVASISVFGLIDRYAGMGFSDDARFYMVLACAFPLAIILSSLFIKERKNYGTAITLSALYATASACFFSAAKIKMVDYATLTYLPYIIVLISIVSMMLLILCFFYAQPNQEGKDNKKPGHII
jgi:hypothetical protein